MQLTIPISPDRGPLFRQVYLGLRRAIASGVLPVNSRLPSTRDLADQLGISRTVVVMAYEQLLAEGFVAGRRGSGTFVSKSTAARRALSKPRVARLRLSRFGAAAVAGASAMVLPTRVVPSPRYDFAFGRSESDVETFPFTVWWRMLTACARNARLRHLDYGPPLGSAALRDAICAHLRRSRAVVCEPSDVIVVSGSQQALDLIARVLLERGDAVAIENPSYQGTREILTAAGARLVPIPIDADGLKTAKLPDDARACFVTPSHQFPTGAILPLSRRLALLAWAKRQNAVVVEDDYDGEFRYDGQPLESLQGHDQDGRIIYVGTFSRTMFPALRVGYLVVPPSLTPAFAAAKWLNDQHSATLEQEALAQFISSGAYARHLRRLRQRNARRRAALLQAVDVHLRARVEMTGAGAGAHVVLWPTQRVDERATVDRARAHGVGIYGIARYFLTRPSRAGFVLGYSRLDEREIREGIRRLGEVL